MTDRAAAWASDRVRTDLVHLDVAACGRTSEAVLAAEVGHLLAEAQRGGYVAEADAEPALQQGRAVLGGLLGLASSQVAWAEGAGTAFQALLSAWPLERGARVGTLPSEYGANALVLDLLARERGWELVALPVDDLGRVQDVPAGLDLVTFPHVASQRGVVQPVAEVLAGGVPLLLDVAQSLGQTVVPPGCAAYVGTSRKWLCGPRGVGFLAVDPSVGTRLHPPPTLSPHRDDEDLRRFDTQEAHVAGRVGLAHAASTWTSDVLPVVHARAARARSLLGVGGWRVVEPVDEPSGITTLVGGDPVATRAALLARGLLVSAVPTTRSADLTAPVLRVSTAGWVRDEDLERLAGALVSLG